MDPRKRQRTDSFEIEQQSDEDVFLEKCLSFLSTHLKPSDAVGMSQFQFNQPNVINQVAVVLREELGIKSPKHHDDMYDSIVYFTSSTSFTASKVKLETLVRPGGTAIFVVPPNHLSMVEDLFFANEWHGVAMEPAGINSLLCIRRNAMTKVNHLPLTESVVLDRPLLFHCKHEPPSDVEQEILNMITVSLNFDERMNGRMDKVSHGKVVECLEDNGVCVIEGLFQSNAIEEWGNSVKGDMTDIIQALKTNHNVDLLNSKEADDLASNFVEISTREALRFDVRRGPRLTALNAQADDREKEQVVLDGEGEGEGEGEGDSSSSSSSTSTSSTTTPRSLSRHHPSLLAVVKDMFNPMSPYYDGNWGKYNFNGGGIGSIPQPVVSPVGCVVSEPGAKSQKIHADTPHLLENQQLAPHYINCFLPIVSDATDLNVGQTGFFIGTHKLREASERIRSIQEQNDGAALKEILVRPHLNTGDCLLFDTRTFHFGLPNTSSNTRRCILYMNFTQHWFARQRTDKNWGKVSCFEAPLSEGSSLSS